MTKIQPARPAVTTIVFRRDATAAPYDYRILFIRRPDTMKSFAGQYAYPGGTVLHDDASPDAMACCDGITPELAGEILGRGAGSHWEGDEFLTVHPPESLRFPPPLAFWVAAARELFEEVGLLITCDSTGNFIDTSQDDVASWVKHQRTALLNGSMSFTQMLKAGNLRVAASRFYYLHRLVAPTFVKRRFDTRFFLVELPPGQEPDPYAGEVDHLVWLTPDEALKHAAEHILETNGSQPFQLPPPTMFTVSTLQRHHKIDEFTQGLSHC